jgi:hypothetical protein
LLFTTTTFGCASKAEQADKTPTTSTTVKNEPAPRTANEQMQDKLTEPNRRAAKRVLAQNAKRPRTRLVKAHRSLMTSCE